MLIFTAELEPIEFNLIVKKKEKSLFCAAYYLYKVTLIVSIESLSTSIMTCGIICNTVNKYRKPTVKFV